MPWLAPRNGGYSAPKPLPNSRAAQLATVILGHIEMIDPQDGHLGCSCCLDHGVYDHDTYATHLATVIDTWLASRGKR